MTDAVYLDHNATTPLSSEVVEAMLPYLTTHFGNPSSSHALGRTAKDAVERAREEVAAAIGARASEIVFTSGGTEANNLAIRGALEATDGRGAPRIVTSVIEHPATAKPVELLERHGFEVARLGVDASGRVREEDAEEALAEPTSLVTVMHSNNETGVLQPIEAIARMGKRCGALVHTDAAQSLGKVEIEVRTLGVDLLSIAGHKLYAPKGVGALFVRDGVPVAPVLLGAGHERGIRPGTENVASIVGLGRACAIAARDVATLGPRLRGLSDRLWVLLAQRVPELMVNGDPLERLPNTLSVRFPRVSGNALLEACPSVLASTGSACHEGHDVASSVIVAMGIETREALGTVRLTLGRSTTEEHVDRAAEDLARAWERLGERT